MVFSSLEFIYLFLPPVFAVFLLLRQLKMETAIIWWLIVASFAFYAWWSLPHLALLLGSIVFNYLLHLRLTASKSKLEFAIGVTVNLATLGLFKYADFLSSSMSVVTGIEMPVLNLVLPLAISFFTFQQISFLHDTLVGNIVRCDFKKYVLFVSFFPQLIAGPIVLQKDTVPQFKLDTFTNRLSLNIAAGTTLFLLGLFKKIVLADGIAPTVNTVFSAADSGILLPAGAAWLGAIAYSFQIYFDFSGYCDMALGIALLFGIRLPVNFNSPYKALSITDFWRRWHMTLSRFLRDYLYIPLGGNKSGLFGRRGNLMITMLLGGLWHGAGWNFVIWGGLHGSFLMINHFWTGSNIREHVANGTVAKVYPFASWIITMLAVVIAWVFFRAETFGGAIIMLQSMFWATDLTTATFQLLPTYEFTTFFLLGCVVFVIVAPNSVEFTGRYRTSLSKVHNRQQLVAYLAELKWSPRAGWGAFTATVGLVSIIQIYRLNGLTEFIYFNF